MSNISLGALSPSPNNFATGAGAIDKKARIRIVRDFVIVLTNI